MYFNVKHTPYSSLMYHRICKHPNGSIIQDRELPPPDLSATDPYYEWSTHNPNTIRITDCTSYPHLFSAFILSIRNVMAAYPKSSVITEIDPTRGVCRLTISHYLPNANPLTREQLNEIRDDSDIIVFGEEIVENIFSYPHPHDFPENLDFNYERYHYHARYNTDPVYVENIESFVRENEEYSYLLRGDRRPIDIEHVEIYLLALTGTDPNIPPRNYRLSTNRRETLRQGGRDSLDVIYKGVLDQLATFIQANDSKRFTVVGPFNFYQEADEREPIAPVIQYNPHELARQYADLDRLIGSLQLDRFFLG